MTALDTPTIIAIAAKAAERKAAALVASIPRPSDGRDGRDGKDGVDGKDGWNGTDGNSGLDGRDGRDGVDGQDGKDGRDGIDGKDGRDGRDGVDGRGIAGTAISKNGNLVIAYDDGTTQDVGHVVGPQGVPGRKGDKGDPGRDGKSGTVYVGGGGSTAPATGGGATFYTHTQTFGDAVWTVTHGLQRRPSVTLTDTAGTQFFAAIEHLSADQVRVTLSEPLAGFAYCV